MEDPIVVHFVCHAELSQEVEQFSDTVMLYSVNDRSVSFTSYTVGG